MKVSKTTALHALAAAALAAGLCACNDSPGDKLDRAIDKTGDAIKDAGDAIKK